MATMRVILCKPKEEPVVAEIEKELRAMQETVGGYIQAVYPFEDNVALVCNDEGKLIGMEPNRFLYDKRGIPYDLIAGPFFICGIRGDDFTSIPKKLEQKYIDMFRLEKHQHPF